MIRILRETHPTPESVAQRLQRAGGMNRFGEPNYRAVWGWNRLTWIGGKFEEHDPATGSLLREVVELRQEPKYPRSIAGTSSGGYRRKSTDLLARGTHKPSNATTASAFLRWDHIHRAANTSIASR